METQVSGSSEKLFAGAQQLTAQMSFFAKRTAEFVASYIRNNGKLGEREYYAHAFAAWLFAEWGSEFDDARHKALDLVNKNGNWVDPSLPTKFHWEFIRFALHNAERLDGLEPYDSVKEVLGRESFSYNRVANWTMLRAFVRIMSPSPANRFLGFLESTVALTYFQKPHGFIEDMKGSPTAQYHAFSTALLGLQILESPLVRKMHASRFAAAIRSLERLTFSDGNMNVLGRGQTQSFGYSAATLAYCIAGKLFQEPRYLVLADQVFQLLARHQREDGSVPLTMRMTEACNGELVQLANPDFIGWYCYNNYFDYMAFTGALISRSIRILADNSIAKVVLPTPRDSTADSLVDDIRILRKPGFEAIVAQPGKVLSDGMPIPYINAGGEQPLPCYGGETYGDALHRPEDLPLPKIVHANGNSEMLFAPLAYRWVDGETFTGHGNGWQLSRRITFQDDGFDVIDEIKLEKRFLGSDLHCARILFFEDSVAVKGEGDLQSSIIRVRSELSLQEEQGRYWSSQGPLTAFSALKPLKTEADLELVTKLSFTIDATRPS